MNDDSGASSASDSVDAAASPDDSGEALAVLAARTADDRKATDILVLDVGAVLSITGYFVIASASNGRLVRNVADEIERAAKEQLGRSPARVEGLREQQWTLIDYGDVVVHVFVDEMREFYEIERLYGDVPRIAWQR
ncbi:MAG: ribosome silencing factor [Ilumatobacter sp.]|jgi:ribosome-associated protein|uniref:ribosome silencing factor n=1 Tax=Ilumatobacter sp. TaxID=1967498 RepID=UPI0039191254